MTHPILDALDERAYPRDSFLEDLGDEISFSLHAASKDELITLLDYLDTPGGQDMLAFLLGIPTKELEDWLMDLALGTRDITPPESFLQKAVESDDSDLGEEADLPEDV